MRNLGIAIMCYICESMDEGNCFRPQDSNVSAKNCHIGDPNEDDSKSGRTKLEHYCTSYIVISKFDFVTSIYTYYSLYLS